MNDWIGKQLGQYRITEEIGRGGMAVVYKAWQSTLGRYVAIKVLPSHFTSDHRFLARFEHEARAAAQLNHPNIVTIHDVGQEGNTHFIVMEFLEGQSLHDLLKTTGAVPLARTTHIVSQLASALDYAHQRGFVHRDIKPANIIIGPGDRATLTDFGIAKAVSGTSLTQTGAMVGTPQYMAPEQVQGESVDHRADIYALGIVCYEMLAGVPPFTGDTAAVLYAQAHKPPPPLRQHLPRLPLHVEGALDRALAKDPIQRFASAGELLGALEMPMFAPSSVTPATPARQAASTPPAAVSSDIASPTPYPAPKLPAQRRALRPQLWLLLGGGVAAALVCIAALALALLRDGGPRSAEQATDPAPTHTEVIVVSASLTPTNTPTPVTPTLTPSNPPPNTAIAPSPTPTPTPTPTSTPAPTPTPPPLRLAFAVGSPGDADIYLTNVDGSTHRLLVGGAKDQAEPDWAPDGLRIAFHSDQAGNYDIWVIGADGQQPQQLTRASVDERAPDWSPDGQQIVYRRGGEPNEDGELWVMNADGGNQRRLGGQRISGRAPVWSPDGRQVAFMSQRSGTWDIYVFDLSSGNVRQLTHCSAHCRFPNWSPDGRYIVFHSTRSASSFTPVRIWRQPADGRGVGELFIEGNNPGRAAWSSADLIAFNTDEAIEIIQTDGTNRHMLRNSDDGWAPDWSR